MDTPLTAQQAVGMLRLTVFAISVVLATIAFRAYTEDSVSQEIKDKHPDMHDSVILEKTLVFFCMASIVALSAIFFLTF